MSLAYFAHPYLSNSALTAIKNELSGRDQYDATEAWAMGSLVDAMLTQPENVNYLTLRVKDRDYQYTKEQFAMARRMKQAALDNGIIKSVMGMAKPQEAFYREKVHFNCDGMDIWYDCKCLVDWFIPNGNGGIDADLKTSACTTREAFLDSIDRLDYDRARVFYSKIIGNKRALLIGLPKKAPHKPFTIEMREGDALWQRGEEKLNTLIKKKYLLGL